jgi:hypothetical protein
MLAINGRTRHRTLRRCDAGRLSSLAPAGKSGQSARQFGIQKRVNGLF